MASNYYQTIQIQIPIKMTKIENLKPGQSLLSSVRRVANDKVQVELVSFVDRGNINVTALFNKSDERFAQNKPRRAWKSGEIADIAELFGIDVAKLNALKEDETIEVGILNPFVLDNSGNKHQLYVQVREYTESEIHARIAVKQEAGQSVKSLEYMLDNADKMAKKNPTTGEHITVNGELIFAETDIVAGKPSHKFVTEVVAEAVASDKPFALNTL